MDEFATTKINQEALVMGRTVFHVTLVAVSAAVWLFAQTGMFLQASGRLPQTTLKRI
jgi:hypothetical protein